MNACALSKFRPALLIALPEKAEQGGAEGVLGTAASREPQRLCLEHRSSVCGPSFRELGQGTEARRLAYETLNLSHLGRKVPCLPRFAHHTAHACGLRPPPEPRERRRQRLRTGVDYTGSAALAGLEVVDWAASSG